MALSDKWILSLDGGGVRGLMVATFLIELEREIGRPLATCFDLIAGTSSGAVLTGSLALGPDGTCRSNIRPVKRRHGAAVPE